MEDVRKSFIFTTIGNYFGVDVDVAELNNNEQLNRFHKLMENLFLMNLLLSLFPKLTSLYQHSYYSYSQALAIYQPHEIFYTSEQTQKFYQDLKHVKNVSDSKNNEKTIFLADYPEARQLLMRDPMTLIHLKHWRLSSSSFRAKFSTFCFELFLFAVKNLLKWWMNGWQKYFQKSLELTNLWVQVLEPFIGLRPGFIHSKTFKSKILLYNGIQICHLTIFSFSNKSIFV